VGYFTGAGVFDAADVVLLATYLAGDAVTLTNPGEADRDSNSLLDSRDLHLLILELNTP